METATIVSILPAQKRERLELDFKNATKADMLEFVQTIAPDPLDYYTIAAVLETHGVRDVDVRDRFGNPTVFELARELYRDYRIELTRDRLAKDIVSRIEDYQPRITLLQKMHTASLFYLRGVFFNAPWVIQVLCLVFFGYAFGVSSAFPPAQAMGAALGMVLSFVVTGGVVQTIGRMASFYLGQQNYVLTHQLYVRAITIGVVLTTVVGLVGYVVVAAFVNVTQEFVAATAAYFILFSILSLYLSLFYILHRYKGLTAVMLTGTVVMVGIMEATSYGIYAAHAAGVCAASVLAVWIIRGYLSEAHRSRTILQQIPALPRFPVLLYNVLPYCLSGTLYFVFLFTDRLVYWTAPSGGKAMATIAGVHLSIYPVYEYGIMWGFVAFALITPIFEYIGARFNLLIKPLQVHYSGMEKVLHNRFFLREYFRYCGILLGCAALAIWVVFDGAMFAQRYDATGTIQRVLTIRLEQAEPVFWWAAIGYGLLAWALMNNLLLFSLGKPWFAVRGLAWGVLANAVVGVFASHSYAATESVMGLAAGAAVMALITMWYAVQTLRQMDYHYYAAY